MKKIIDGRKLPCPQPLMMTKKAVDKGDSDIIEVIVDNEAGRENIIKYANHAKIKIAGITENNGEIRLTLIPEGFSDSEKDTLEDTPAPECITGEDTEDTETHKDGDGGLTGGTNTAKTVFIRTDTIGTDNKELGQLLMRGFLYTLTEMDDKPAEIIFMNEGVKLAVEGSDSLENITKLENAGISVLVCGTCLDYLKLTSKLKAGKISNMYEITERLLAASSVLTV